MTAQAGTGRTNQKQRTRMAIVAAARELIGTGAEVTMPAIARAALVSEATAYRYFPDLPSLISEALAGVWPPPAEALAPVADSADPVERVAFACEFLLRGIRARQGSVRAMIAATITRPETVTTRPGIRFGLIDHALLPLEGTLGTTDPDVFAQLKRDLAVVVSAEAFFTLTDLCGLDADEAIASAVRTATTLTEAAVR
ncbi:AcrR family transcriptional regulator [Streptomyces phaeochromogenes]|jgi:AcrR family transcriptional regulator|uniref:TetR/AcrR family transcriptional regulator n=1 Tax=Streptomyces phaeochromogenes TaxID=1923 RepID=UPI0027925772|nr:TetR/AcrR family transcriptional regulator [Streptomyces phaeochromogenes]MDQ0955284.1 AcrR family transcriptional regulator [Streptomyces phaeochromogenes]